MNTELLFSKALTAYGTGNLDEAETLFREVLQMDPYNAGAFYFLGVIALTKGVLDEAVNLLYQATLLAPDNQDYQYSLAVALQEDGKLSEAAERYEKLTQMPEAFNNLGNIWRTKGLYDKAEQAFDKALSMNPKMLWAYVNKALLMRDRGQPQKAEALLDKALLLKADFVPALYQRSVQYRQTGDTPAAKPLIERALAIEPDKDFLWVEMGKVQSLLNEPDKALASFDKAIHLNRFCADAYFEKALLEETLNPLQAEQDYRCVLRINPNNTAAYNNLGSLLYKQSRTNEALEMYRQVVILNPKDKTALYNLATILEDVGDYQEAAGLYFNLLGQHQLEMQAHLRLVSLLTKWHDKAPTEALKYAEGWLKNFPDNPLAKHTYAALHGAQNERGEDKAADNDGDKGADETADFAYTQTLYDAFADSYDDKMKLLKCQIPAAIAQELAGKHFKNALDLGCGTGACGALLSASCDKLTGVDCSVKMIQKAQSKNAYSALYTQDILDYLAHEKEQFDLILSADVFCYIHNLKPVFKAIQPRLSPNGLFVFSIEDGENDVKLNVEGRYLHAPKLVDALLAETGFQVIKKTSMSLRRNGSSMSKGTLYVAAVLL